MSAMDIEDLELQALEQRNRLHRNADDLRAKIAATRDKLRFEKQARQHFMGASILVTVLSLGLGYAAGGLVAAK